MTCNHEYIFGLHEFATVPTCLMCGGRKTDNELTAANARIAELEGALREAIESVEDWAGYASAYFREKHDLEGEVKKLRKALENA